MSDLEQKIRSMVKDGSYLCVLGGSCIDLNEIADRIAELERQNAELREVLGEFRRAIGDHYAPNDCYATGPVTGDPIRDLVECPACSAIAMFDVLAADQKGKAS